MSPMVRDSQHTFTSKNAVVRVQVLSKPHSISIYDSQTIRHFLLLPSSGVETTSSSTKTPAPTSHNKVERNGRLDKTETLVITLEVVPFLHDHQRKDYKDIVKRQVA